MGSFARFLLMTTALAPAVAVFGISRITASGQQGAACAWILIAIVQALLCHLLLGVFTQRIQTKPLKLRAAKNIDRDTLIFLVAYLLPLSTRDLHQAVTNVPALAAGAVLMLLIVYRTETYLFNPLVSLLGYRFYEAQTDDGLTVYLLNRSPIINLKDVLHVRYISGVIAVVQEDRE
jgi:hypothetical protein